MPRVRIWSPAELEWLLANRAKPTGQLAGMLMRPVGAVKNKLKGLGTGKHKKPIIVSAPGPVRNKISYIGKRPDCDNLFLRSRWEANWFRYLKHVLKIDKIEYEPHTFLFTPFGIKRGTLSYTPDFRVATSDGRQEWHEIKGYLGSQGGTKLRRFKKFYPSEFRKLVLITGGAKTGAHKFARELGVGKIIDFKAIDKQCRDRVPHWE